MRKTYKTVLVRLSPEQYEELRTYASKTGESPTNQATIFVRRSLRRARDASNGRSVASTG